MGEGPAGVNPSASMNFTSARGVGSSMRAMRRLLLLIGILACSRGARKDVSPPLAAQAPEAAAQQAALDAPPALLQPEMIEHALSRVTFGARPQDRARLRRVGIAAFIEEQLHPEAIDDSALEQRLRKFEVLQKGPDELVQKLLAQRRDRKHEQLLAQAPPPPEEESGQMIGHQMSDHLAPARPDAVAQLAQVKLLRAVASARQLQEVMVDFWFNHFNVFAGKQEEAALLPDYEERALRPFALGNFKDLLEATAHSPAMLIYLDNWRSASPRPNQKQRGLNENYARELLELHTLGVDGGYTQRDIVEVARCFTGWTVDTPQKDPRFVFRPGMHDFGRKVVLGDVIPAGGGIEDGEQVLRILEAHPSTARFIAGKLARRFVSDDPPQSLVDRAAAEYLRTRGDVRSMLRALFESPEFWSRRALKAKVRSPLELVAGAVRALDASVDEPAALARAVARIGEPLYAAQPPTGYPDLAQGWLSSGALLARIDFGLQLASGQLAGVKVDLSPLSGGGPQDLLDKAAAQLGATELSQRTRESIVQQLEEKPLPARAVGLLLGAPEMQRR